MLKNIEVAGFSSVQMISRYVGSCLYQNMGRVGGPVAFTNSVVVCQIWEIRTIRIPPRRAIRGTKRILQWSWRAGHTRATDGPADRFTGRRRIIENVRLRRVSR